MGGTWCDEGEPTVIRIRSFCWVNRQKWNQCGWSEVKAIEKMILGNISKAFHGYVDPSQINMVWYNDYTMHHGERKHQCVCWLGIR